jgi:hypothetical protein
MNESSLAQLLATAEQAIRAVAHGRQALRRRIEGIEHQAAGLRALAAYLAAAPARSSAPRPRRHRAA